MIDKDKNEPREDDSTEKNIEPEKINLQVNINQEQVNQTKNLPPKSSKNKYSFFIHLLVLFFLFPVFLGITGIDEESVSTILESWIGFVITMAIAKLILLFAGKILATILIIFLILFVIGIAAA